MRFAGVPGAFGNVDLTLVSDTHILHVDWKFGAGVGVQAIYPAGDGELVNPQLMFYAAAYLHSSRPSTPGGKSLSPSFSRARPNRLPTRSCHAKSYGYLPKTCRTR